jgi:hypothetical protein
MSTRDPPYPKGTGRTPVVVQEKKDDHYYRIFNGGRCFWFTMVDIPTAIDQRSRLMILTVVAVLGQLLRLIHINGGGCFNASASFKWLTVAVACYLPAMIKIFQN